MCMMCLVRSFTLPINHLKPKAQKTVVPTEVYSAMMEVVKQTRIGSGIAEKVDFFKITCFFSLVISFKVMKYPAYLVGKSTIFHLLLILMEDFRPSKNYTMSCKVCSRKSWIVSAQKTIFQLRRTMQIYLCYIFVLKRIFLI